MYFHDDAYSQQNFKQLSFNHITVNNGLSQGVNNCVWKDSRGFVWISSFDGLNRFDGTECINFREDKTDSNSISGTLFRNIVETKNGDLIIGSNGGINWYHRRENRFSHFELSNKQTGTVHYNPVYIDDQQNIWVQCGFELFVFNLNTRQFQPVHPGIVGHRLQFHMLSQQPFQPVDSWLMIDQTYRSWHLFKRKQGSWISGLLPYPQVPNMQVIDINDVLHEGGQFLLAATSAGLFRMDVYSNTCQWVGSATTGSLMPITCLARDKQQQLWMGTAANGLLLVDGESLELQQRFSSNYPDPTAISGNQVQYIHIDENANLWVAIWGKGIDYCNLEKFRFAHYLLKPTPEDRLKDNFIRSLAEGDGEIWCGTQSDGVIVLDNNKQLLRKYGAPLPDAIEHVLRDGEGNIWVATFKGLFVKRRKASQFEAIRPYSNFGDAASNQFNHLIQLKSGLLLAASNNGVFHIAPSKGQWLLARMNEIPDQQVYLTLFEDRRNRLYVSKAFAGLEVYDSIGGHLQKIRSYDYKATVKCFVECADTNYLLLGTTQGLLQIEHFSGKIKKWYTQKDGLPNQYIYGILPSDPDYWISTNAGISRFNLKTRQFRNFNIGDGLQSNEFNTYSFLKREDGEFLFGGVNGLNGFYPNLRKPYAYPPDIQITDIRINDLKYNLPAFIGETDTIHLQYEQNTIELFFTALEYANPSGNLLMCQLEGVDKNWITARNKGYARYVNVPAGQYRFRVKAIGSEGNESQYERILHINIQQPWWNTWWFVAVIFLVGSILTFLLIRAYTTRKLNIQKRQLESQQAIEKERTRIALDMHDDLGAGLSSLRFLSEKVKRTATGEDVQKDADKIVFYSNELVQKMNELIWAMNEKNDAMEDLLFYTRAYAADYCENNQLQLHIQLPDPVPTIHLSGEIRRNVFLAVKESLHNIVKHAQATEVSLTFELNAGFNITIADNGRGFEPGKDTNGNGLMSMRKRMESVGGSFQMEPGNPGITVRLHIPLGNHL